ncbi:MAG TPA: PspC domain-containing protein [Anaerolineaceae bacterium]
MATRKLYRSQTGKMIGGVCAGLAEYFDLDPTLVRLVFVLLLFTPLHGLLLYLILWLITPVAPLDYPMPTPPAPPSSPQVS